MTSKAKTVKEYVASLPPDRRAAIEAVREIFKQNVGKGIEEGMQYGLIGYYIPHSVYPPGYHCDPKQPLSYAGIASQKHHMSIYLMCLYGDSEHQKWFRAEWAKTGKKLDMGKACIRFKRLEDLPLDLIGRAIARVPAEKYIAFVEKAREALDDRKKKAKKA